MAPHRVIEDSDEDGASFGSPDSESPSAAMQEVSVVPMMQLSSTGEFSPRQPRYSVPQTKTYYKRPNSVSSSI